MSTVYNLNVTEEIVNHFNNILVAPVKNDRNELLSAVKSTIKELKSQDVEEYVTNHIQPLEDLLQLITDEKWRLSEQDKSYVLAAMHYFADEHDIIPDSTPVVGYLDDCIVIDIVSEKLQQDLKEHKKFVNAAKIYAKDTDYSIEDWQQTKRHELFSRIRHRRLKGLRRKSNRGTSFSV